jgi:hypothetical protein
LGSAFDGQHWKVLGVDAFSRVIAGGNCDEIGVSGSTIGARCLHIDGVGATGQMDHLYNPGDRHLGGFPGVRLQRGSGSTRRVWAAIPNLRRPRQITIQAAPNVANDSPAAFLAKKNPPPRIQYKRVTPRFFAVSSYKGDKVWYDRCNFSRGLVHCVLINYPAREERA